MTESKKTGSIFDSLEQLGSGGSYLADISDMLEGADMLRDFSRQEVEVLARYITAYQARPGAYVLREGSRESYMFILASGKLDIMKSGDEPGIGKKLATIRAGKTVGEMSLVDGLPHSACAVAVETTRLLLITKRQFDQFCEQNPIVALKFMKKVAILMSLRLRQTSGVLVDYLEK